VSDSTAHLADPLPVRHCWECPFDGPTGCKHPKSTISAVERRAAMEAYEAPRTCPLRTVPVLVLLERL